MRKQALFAAAAAVAVVAVPAAGEPTKAAPHHSDRLSAMLDLRLRSIELQIDTLRDRELIGAEEAQDLRQEARRLERRLYRLPGRQAGDVELAVERLQRQLRFAAGDGRFATLRRDLGRFDDGDRYQPDRGSDYEKDSYRPADPLGDPFAIWKERDERGPH
jgi:hypothetical protein